MSETDRLFAKANTRIHMARDGIARMEKIVRRMNALGEDSADHEATLTILKQSLALMEQHLYDMRRRRAVKWASQPSAAP